MERARRHIRLENRSLKHKRRFNAPQNLVAIGPSRHAALRSLMVAFGAKRTLVGRPPRLTDLPETSGPMLCSKWGRGDKREAKLAPALDGLIASGLLFRQGIPPHATYPFKHALVQDAACGTLLRDARRALHVSFIAGQQRQNPGCVAEMSHSFSPSHVNLGQASVPIGLGFSASWAQSGIVPSIGRIGCRCSQIREIKIFLKWRLPVFRGSLS